VVPITLHLDGRKTHPPHLRTFRVGWRTLRVYLLFSPRWAFLLPGLGMMLLGLLGYLIAFPGLKIGSATFDVHTLLIASLFILLGYQAMLFGIFSKTFAIQEGLLPPDPRLKYFFPVNRVEQGLLGGLFLALFGLGLIGIPAWNWLRGGFGPLEYTTNMRWVIPGFTLTSLGFLTILASFLVGILGLSRK